MSIEILKTDDAAYALAFGLAVKLRPDEEYVPEPVLRHLLVADFNVALHLFEVNSREVPH